VSRIGKKAIVVGSAVKFRSDDAKVYIGGQKGELEAIIPKGIRVEFDSGSRNIVVLNNGGGSAMQGLVRALLANMVIGVTSGFERKLEIHGVGYQASVKLGKISLNVGFSKPVELNFPSGVSVNCPDSTHIIVAGCDKQSVGQFAATIRAVRPPEPYKGKGIRYTGEFVRRKAGKAFGAK